VLLVVVVSGHFNVNEFAGAHLLGSLLKRATGDLKDSEGNSTVKQWRFYIGARGAQAPQILPRPPKFLDTVVLLLVELIGSIVNFA